MVMSWFDTIIMIIVIGVAMGIFYKALKEPIDLIVGLIGKGLGAARDKLAETTGGTGEESTVIRYG